MAESLKPGECPNCYVRLLAFTKIDDDREMCPICGCILMHCLDLEVVKVPAGPAPLKFREDWVGLRLLARKTPLKGPEVDFTNDSGDMVIREKAYMVPIEIAIEILQKKSLEAANWFRMHCPSWMEHLTFRISEVKVIEEICVFNRGPFVPS